MKTEICKYDIFSEIFKKLPEESQDKLVILAQQLLEAQKYAEQETTPKVNTCLGATCYGKNYY